MKLGARVFGAVALLLLLFLLVGLLLPGRWEARTEAILPRPPEDVFPYLTEMRAWTRWNSMPDSGLTVVGPASGKGAGLRWNDPRYGSGEMRVVRSRPPRELRYEVAMEGGDLQVRGSILLEGRDGRTRLEWTEAGDFGWNPLLGYAARGMARSQARAMDESLASLASLLEEEGEGLNPP
jgi:uncharacterized protein YndB with AHSA1/START domain